MKNRRTTLPDAARLHDSALQAIARGDVDPPKQRRVSQDKVLAYIDGHQLRVMREAWEPTIAWVEAKGLPRSCIEIVSATHVIVHNHPVSSRRSR